MLNCPHCEQSLTAHEIGVLHAAVARTENRTSLHYWGAKLTEQDANRIRKSKKTNWEQAKKYKVSFATITRLRNNQTHKVPIELKCPHCEHKLTPKVINKLFAALGGSKSTLRQAQRSIANGRKRSRLTEEDVADIRNSNASTKELVKKYKVSSTTITEIRRYARWKSVPSE